MALNNKSQRLPDGGEQTWRLENAGQHKSLLDALIQAGAGVPAQCGGKGKCGKCLVRLAPDAAVNPPDESETNLLGQGRLDQGLRLACRVRASEPVELAGAWILEAELDRGVCGKELVQCSCKTEPAVLRRVVEPWPPPAADGRSLLQSLALQATKVASPSLEFVRDLGRVPSDNGAVTVVVNQLTGACGMLSGRCEAGLGVAIDLGTTSIAAYLCDLRSGRVLDAAATPNPQATRGADVINRLGYADTAPGGLAELAGSARETVNGLCVGLLKRNCAGMDQIDEITLAGNTAMLHIFLEIPVKTMTLFPFTRVMGRPLDIPARKLGLNTPHWTNVHVLPSVSGFLGADIVAAVLAAQCEYKARPMLVIDLGTNGEVALVTENGIAAASCAIGPALEGAQISCGMRAVAGAIHKVEPDDGGGLRVQWIGQDYGQTPKGICGSGLIDAAAAMRCLGMLDESGRLVPDADGVNPANGDDGPKVVLWAGADGAEIALTQLDIRQLQLAKAALNVGIESLMTAMGVREVALSVLTGAFGAGFDHLSAQKIGMLPGEEAGDVVTMNNAAGLGAVMTLVNIGYRDEAGDLALKIKHVDLVQDQTLAERFAMSTMFPKIPGQ